MAYGKSKRKESRPEDDAGLWFLGRIVISMLEEISIAI